VKQDCKTFGLRLVSSEIECTWDAGIRQITTHAM